MSIKPKLFLQLILTLVIAGCASVGGANPTSDLVATSPTVENSQTPQFTKTPTREPTPAATSGPLPASFDSHVLRDGIEPVSYVEDSCGYLAMRWDPVLSTPGTVVAVVMFHSILKGNGTPSLPQDINKETFDEIIHLAENLGYETITTEELLGFLQENAKIPPRSLLMILDDRKPGTAEDYFLPILEQNEWSTTLAWIIGDTDSRDGRLAGESMWDWIERINDTGYFDIQSHGLNHIPITEGLTRDFVREEIEGGIPILIEHFGQRPIAYIWPGGNYTQLGVEIARQAGFELGFTVHSRGPVMFNWIPQGEQEMTIGDPLMTLPRFWDSAALLNLEQTAEIGDAARDFARANYEAEAGWFAANCGGELAMLDEVLR